MSEMKMLLSAIAATVLLAAGCQQQTTAPTPKSAAKVEPAKPAANPVAEPVAPPRKEPVAESQATAPVEPQEKKQPAAVVQVAAALEKEKVVEPRVAAAPAKPQAEVAKAEKSAPTARTVFYRADTKPAAMPRVLLSKGEEALCKLKVGDAMPAIELPKLDGSGAAKLADLAGKKATVVVFWKGDRRMANEQLADLGPDVVELFGKNGVAVVGVAVNETNSSAPDALKKAGANFPNLLDADGKAFAQLGSGRLPRTYVLDPSGKILWFDIEYSHATRRELHQALRAVAGDQK